VFGDSLAETIPLAEGQGFGHGASRYLNYLWGLTGVYTIPLGV
jgi:hypothetical protein